MDGLHIGDRHICHRAADILCQLDAVADGDGGLDGQLVLHAVGQIRHTGGLCAEGGEGAQIVIAVDAGVGGQLGGVAAGAEDDGLAVTHGDRFIEGQLVDALDHIKFHAVNQLHGAAVSPGGYEGIHIHHAHGQRTGIRCRNGQCRQLGAGVSGLTGQGQIGGGQRHLLSRQIDDAAGIVGVFIKADGVLRHVVRREVHQLHIGAVLAAPDVAVIADVGAVACGGLRRFSVGQHQRERHHTCQQQGEDLGQQLALSAVDQCTGQCDAAEENCQHPQHIVVTGFGGGSGDHFRVLILADLADTLLLAVLLALGLLGDGPVTKLVLFAVELLAARAFQPVVGLVALPIIVRIAVMLVDDHGLGIGGQNGAAGLHAHKICTRLQSGELLAGDGCPLGVAHLLILHSAVHAGDGAVIVVGVGAIGLGDLGRSALGHIDGLLLGVIGGGTVTGDVQLDVIGSAHAGQLCGIAVSRRPGAAAIGAVLRTDLQTAQHAGAVTGGGEGGLGCILRIEDHGQRKTKKRTRIVGGIVAVALLVKDGQRIVAGGQCGDLDLRRAGGGIVGDASVVGEVVVGIHQQDGHIFISAQKRTGIVQRYLAAIHRNGEAGAAIGRYGCHHRTGGVKYRHLPRIGLFRADGAEGAVHSVSLAAHSGGGGDHIAVPQIHSGAGSPVQVSLTVDHLAGIGHHTGVQCAVLACRAQPPGGSLAVQLCHQLAVVIGGADVLCQLGGGEEEHLVVIQRRVAPFDVIDIGGAGSLVGLEDGLQLGGGEDFVCEVFAPALGVAAVPGVAVGGGLVKGTAVKQRFTQQEESVCSCVDFRIQHAPGDGRAVGRAEIDGVTGCDTGLTARHCAHRGGLRLRAQCRRQSQHQHEGHKDG